MDSAILTQIIKGFNKTDSVRFTYVNKVNVWWPPNATLAQMGAPTLAKKNIYNYFAYAFWTCTNGPSDILKVYDDPIKYLGTDVGATKSISQAYIKSFYTNNNVKLMVSAFGAT